MQALSMPLHAILQVIIWQYYVPFNVLIAYSNILDDLNFACAMWSALLMQVRIGGISLAGTTCDPVRRQYLTHSFNQQQWIRWSLRQKKSEEDYVRFRGAVDRSGWLTCV